MRFYFVCLALLGLVVAGCGVQSNASLPKGNIPAPNPNGDSVSGEMKLTPVAIDSGVAKLTPDNTSIEFRGSKPGGHHVGGFKDFSGKIDVDAKAKALKGISVEIQTDSLWSDNGKLTGHLKSPDFFNTRQFPKSTFTSTNIKATDAGKGQYEVTGKLNLHGVEKEVTFPATVTFGDQGLTMASKFQIDRTNFGMEYGKGKVNNEVDLNVAIGKKTESK